MHFMLMGLIGVLFFNNALAWNALGHQIVAQIAIDQLSQKQTRKLEKINSQLNALKPQAYTLVYASIWMDRIKSQGVTWMNPYHYVNLGFSEDHTPVQPPDSINGIWAIDEARATFKQSYPNPANQAFSLRVLLHVVGDLHQPMHTVSEVSQQYPQGDRGGNLFLLGKNSYAKNLHEYWDRGGGYLYSRSKVTPAKIKKLAHALERKYPCTGFNNLTPNPSIWVKESHALGLKFGYQLKPMQVPGKAYQKQVKQITQKQLALAGCRLGTLLKNI